MHHLRRGTIVACGQPSRSARPAPPDGDPTAVAAAAVPSLAGGRRTKEIASGGRCAQVGSASGRGTVAARRRCSAWGRGAAGAAAAAETAPSPGQHAGYAISCCRARRRPAAFEQGRRQPAAGFTAATATAAAATRGEWQAARGRNEPPRTVQDAGAPWRAIRAGARRLHSNPCA